MASSLERAFQIPDVMDAIASWIPLVRYDPMKRSPSFMFTQSTSFLDEYTYTPHHLLSCTLVSRKWHALFTPYLYQDYIGPFIREKGLLGCTLGPKSNSRHIRRFLLQSKDDCRLYRKGLAFSPPTNLVELFLFWTSDENAKLLHHNQGPQLRKLVWHRGALKERMAKVHQDALLNLPYLEELDLSGWIMTDDFLLKMLKACSRTLTTLRLATQGLIEGAYTYEPGTTEYFFELQEHELMLPKLKSLTLDLGLSQRIIAILLQVCPAMEEFRVILGNNYRLFPHIAETLQQRCPNLHAIHYVAPIDSTDGTALWVVRDSEEYILFRDCCSKQGLKHASLRCTKQDIVPIAQALQSHSATLVSLELLQQRGYKTIPPTFMDCVLSLLTTCGSLKDLRLRADCTVDEICQIFHTPWACKGLEAFVIDDYRPSDWDLYHPSPISVGVRAKLLDKCQRARTKTWPGSKHHHEYRHDGQGWFLKPGLEKTYYYHAFVDASMKRKLFEHMSASGIKQAKYVRLNGAEFFAQEQ